MFDLRLIRLFALYGLLVCFMLCSVCLTPAVQAQGIIVDHNCTRLSQIPQSAILQAKRSLHIAYGHTSHGSQLIDGMTGLISFSQGGSLYSFNSTGVADSLQLLDNPFSGASDLGNPDLISWNTATRNYLITHSQINVVIWSWCGQVSTASSADIDTYLALMNQLGHDYPQVNFVYMTGHLDGTGQYGTLNQRNEQIRNYCRTNGKILYDFADIESYDPEGVTNYMLLGANDNCDYDSDGNGSLDRNWAVVWQNSHIMGVDWYNCTAAHSQPLNGNRKAYAAWHLWARLAGWAGAAGPADTTPPSVPTNVQASLVNGKEAVVTWNASSDNVGVTGYNIYRNGVVLMMAVAGTSFHDYDLQVGVTYRYTLVATDAAGNISGQSSPPASVLVPTVINHPPSLNSIGTRSIEAGTTFSFIISGSDQDGDNLTYSAQSLPYGATFDANTRLFAWVPALTQSGSHTVVFSVSDGRGGSASEEVTLTVALGENASTLLVPVILALQGVSFYSSEITFTNKSDLPASLTLYYKAEWGMGSGQVPFTIPAKKQVVYADAISMLRQLGLPIPSSGNQGGTLRIQVDGASVNEIGVTVRTTNPVPEGRVGLAYSGIPRNKQQTGIAYIGGLRNTTQDRSHVAVINSGMDSEGPITLRVTLYSGDVPHPINNTLPDINLAPGEFHQWNEVLIQAGVYAANGWAKIEKISGTAPYYAYGIINDQLNSDGSFLAARPEAEVMGLSPIILPAVVEAGNYRTELMVANFSDQTRQFTLRYSASEIVQGSQTLLLNMSLAPNEQLIIPDFVSWLRSRGFIFALPAGKVYAGMVRADLDTGGIYLGARTYASAPNGNGKYGVHYSAYGSNDMGTTELWCFSLQQNTENRSNLALLNTGITDANDITLEITLFDGVSGLSAGTFTQTLRNREWIQFNRVLPQYAPGVAQGFARITRTRGANPFIAYAVINDGANPGERSGDGAFISGNP